MKEIICFEIDRILLENFDEYCKKNFINRDRLIEELIDEYLTEKNNNSII